jgi:hypothetical protein
MMAVMRFDAERRARLISVLELDRYAAWLAARRLLEDARCA